MLYFDPTPSADVTVTETVMPVFFVYRYRTYTTQTMPIIERYEKRGMVRKISGVPPPEQVRGCAS